MPWPSGLSPSGFFSGSLIARSFVYSGHADDCALLRDWVGRPVDVFFDFGGPALWWLHPNLGSEVLLSPVAVEAFVEMLHKAMPFMPIRIEH